MRSRFVRLHERPGRTIVVAVALAAGALVLIASGAGWGAVGHAFSDFHPGWIALCVLAQGVALAGYAAAYRSVARLHGGPRLPAGVALRMVVAGFGAFAVGGGFAFDRRALHAAGRPPDDATIRVLGLGALEYAVLGPAACAAAIALLAEGGEGVHGAVLWPWAIAVPVGFALGFWLVAPERRARVRRAPLRIAMTGVGLVLELAAHPVRHAGAWIGMAVYWAADIASLYGALRLFGVHLGAAGATVAYATGYALTRRTLPLGGAGATEALMALSLFWVGVPIARAVPPVLAYRVANFLLPLPPAARAHRTTVRPLLYRSDARRAAPR